MRESYVEGVATLWPRQAAAASGPMMSARSPKNVIVVIRETERFARRCESLPPESDDRSLKRPDSSLYGVTLRDLIEREGEGS